MDVGLFPHERSELRILADAYDSSPETDFALHATFHSRGAIDEPASAPRRRRDTLRRRIEPTLIPHLSNGNHETRIDGGRPARLWMASTPGPPFSTSNRIRLPRA